MPNQLESGSRPEANQQSFPLKNLKEALLSSLSESESKNWQIIFDFKDQILEKESGIVVIKLKNAETKFDKNDPFFELNKEFQVNLSWLGKEQELSFDKKVLLDPEKIDLIKIIEKTIETKVLNKEPKYFYQIHQKNGEDNSIKTSWSEKDKDEFLTTYVFDKIPEEERSSFIEELIKEIKKTPKEKQSEAIFSLSENYLKKKLNEQIIFFERPSFDSHEEEKRKVENSVLSERLEANNIL